MKTDCGPVEQVGSRTKFKIFSALCFPNCAHSEKDTDFFIAGRKNEYDVSCLWGGNVREWESSGYNVCALMYVITLMMFHNFVHIMRLLLPSQCHCPTHLNISWVLDLFFIFSEMEMPFPSSSIVSNLRSLANSANSPKMSPGLRFGLNCCGFLDLFWLVAVFLLFERLCLSFRHLFHKVFGFDFHLHVREQLFSGELGFSAVL